MFFYEQAPESKILLSGTLRTRIEWEAYDPTRDQLVGLWYTSAPRKNEITVQK